MTAAVATHPKATLQPPLLAVKVAPGHEEDEALLRRTDLPAAGWVTQIYRRGSKLLANFREMPEVVQDLVNRRAYRKISAEIYTEFRDQGQDYGLVLRRVVMLGGEIPQVKTLADIPTVAAGAVDGVEIFATGEHRGRVWTEADLDQIVTNFNRLSAGQVSYSEATYASILVFHEVRPMKKFPTALQLKERTGKLSEKARGVLKKFADELAPAAATEDAPAPPPPQDVTAEGMMALLGEWGFDTKLLESIKDEKALAEIVRWARTQMGSTAPAPAPEPQPGAVMSAPPIAPAPAPVPTPAAIPPQQPSSVTLKYGEQNITLPLDLLKPLVDAAVKPLQDQLTGAQQNINEFQRNTKKASIEAFCDRMKTVGRLIPAQEERVKARLQRADAVVKFSDGRTELDLQMAEIEAGPELLKFSQAVKSGGKVKSNDADVAEVEQHFEQFADTFERYGMTKERRVEAFKAAKKTQPKLTAAEYLRTA